MLRNTFAKISLNLVARDFNQLENSAITETPRVEEETAKPNAQLSPLMRQYWDVKSQYPDVLLFFRLGDFYELFDGDAHVAARELDITLTGRPDPSYPNNRVPMAGVPVRSVDLYLTKLLSKGYSVAICEQVGVVGADKGPVERKVTRILTPGTVLESHLLPAKQSNYLLALVRGDEKSESLWGLAAVEASCGEFFVTQLSEEQLQLEIARLEPKEVLAAKRTVKPGPNEVLPKEVLDIPESLKGKYRFVGRPALFFQYEPSRRRICDVFGVSTLEGFGCHTMPLAVSAAGAVLEYLQHTQNAEMPKFSGISTYSADSQMVLDTNTRRNLELSETFREQSFEGSLLWALDETVTNMGSRLLRSWLVKPLYSVPEIHERQNAIGELCAQPARLKAIGANLAKLADLERLAVKLLSATANPKDLIAISFSLAQLPVISEALVGTQGRYFKSLVTVPSSLNDLARKIDAAIADNPPREISDGGIFRNGYSEELDNIRILLGGNKQWIEEFQKREQERTGVRSLKIGFNHSFGYYIEITHANKDSIPTDYIRKQTLTNAERFITPELKEYESKILNAESHQSSFEYKLFIELRQSLTSLGSDLLKVARHLAELDVLQSFATVALERNYVRPEVDDSLVIDIKGGRHPVLEKILSMGKYVANDTRLQGDSDDHQLMILTGPNMSGKSSLLRQVAQIVILAQIGSFVPAEKARIGLVDRIFTRIGAVDDLTQGQSTFLVEMSETTQCCLSATARSLILLDEVGRGTSTYDGVAIAWSVAEYLANVVRARTIFATHYHELNGLANLLPQVVNYQVLVKETDGHVEFIRSVVPGGASRSYGVQVAKMAGLPPEVIDRAQYLMSQMEKRSSASKILDGPKFRNTPMDEVMQLSVFEPGT